MAATGEDCKEDGAEVCASCNVGFHVSAGVCSANLCACANGEAASGASCTNDRAEICNKCIVGFHLTLSIEPICSVNVCTCDGGLPSEGTDCNVHGSVSCSACDLGKHVAGNGTSLNCVQNTCACMGGVAATGALCVSDQASICTRCDAGYTFVDNQCVLTTSTTTTTMTTIPATIITTVSGLNPICLRACTYGDGGCRRYVDDSDVTSEILCDRHIEGNTDCPVGRVDCGPDIQVTTTTPLTILAKSLDTSIVAGAAVGGALVLILIVVGWHRHGYHKKKGTEKQVRNQIYENAIFEPQFPASGDGTAPRAIINETYSTAAEVSLYSSSPGVSLDPNSTGEGIGGYLSISNGKEAFDEPVEATVASVSMERATVSRNLKLADPATTETLASTNIDEATVSAFPDSPDTEAEMTSTQTPHSALGLHASGASDLADVTC